MSSNEAGTFSGPQHDPLPEQATRVQGAQAPAASTQAQSALGHAVQLLASLTGLTADMGHDGLVLMSDEDLLAITQQLELASRRIDSLLVTASGAIDQRSDPHLEDSLAKQRGCRNATELLQRLSQHSSATIGRRLKVARATRTESGFTGSTIPPKFPAVANALAAGDLPEETAFQIIKSLSCLPSHVDSTGVEIAERGIVSQAAGYSGAGHDAEGNEGDEGEETAPLPQDCDTIKLVCQTWSTFLDQDGAAPTEATAMQDRYLWLGPEKDGLVPLHGRILPEAAALLGTLFTTINSPHTSTNAVDPTGTHGGSDSCNIDRPNPQSDSASNSRSGHKVEFVESEGAEALEADGDDEFADELPGTDIRSYGQKLHDAFKIVAEIAARAAETPQLGGAPVTVLIQTTQEELAASIAFDLEQAAMGAGSGGSGDGAGWQGLNISGAGSIGPGTTGPETISAGTVSTGTKGPGTAWIHGHDGQPTPTSMATARHGICTGATQRVITGPRGEILGIDSPTRIFTPHQRRAITARDGGCIIPGCTVPATWCEVHHVVEWANGGPTSTDNGVLVCWYHHRNLDSNDWHIRMVDGLPEVLAPPWIDPHQKWRQARPPLRAAQSRKHQDQQRRREASLRT